ncbi:MAG TPA: cytochrome P450 [Acidimicrobiales bacterium]
MTDADLYDPDGYVDGPPHEVFARLRREQPVYRQTMPDGTEYWAVLRHADVVHVARQPVVFSASLGGVVLEDLSEEQLAMMRDMVLAMDPPRHIDYRRNLAPHFKSNVIGSLEPRIRAICRAIFDDVADGDEVDFVHDVSAKLPSQVVGELVGIPREDWPKIHAWSEQNSGGQDPDIASSPDGDEPHSTEAASDSERLESSIKRGEGSASDEPHSTEAASDSERLQSSIKMAMYAIGLAEQRRAEPQEDLATLILAADIGGRPMTEIEFGSFFVQLVTAGNDTTRTMLSSGLLALLQHPDQLDALRAEPSRIPGAVEEILRWANPLHYFRRTASQDTAIGDQPIKHGEKVAMMYTSANRDDDVFEDPDRFDISRDPNPHLSFGIGEHFCLGVHLARLEGRVFFEELLATFGGIELVGEPRRQRSNLNNALKALPVRLVRTTSP